MAEPVRPTITSFPPPYFHVGLIGKLESHQYQHHRVIALICKLVDMEAIVMIRILAHAQQILLQVRLFDKSESYSDTRTGLSETSPTNAQKEVLRI
jgi:hypothetical protein